MYTQTFNSLKAKLNAVNQKIANLESVETDYAVIDELIHERTELQWAIVAAIDNNN